MLNTLMLQRMDDVQNVRLPKLDLGNYDVDQAFTGCPLRVRDATAEACKNYDCDPSRFHLMGPTFVFDGLISQILKTTASNDQTNSQGVAPLFSGGM
jgi:hypothetical protein